LHVPRCPYLPPLAVLHALEAKSGSGTLALPWERDRASPTIEQPVRLSMRMPVLVYERVKTAQHLGFFKRYINKLVFAGKLNVLGILLIGLRGYWYLMGTRYGPPAYEELLSIMRTAKLDIRVYRVVDWFQHNGRLIVYVAREPREWVSLPNWDPSV